MEPSRKACERNTFGVDVGSRASADDAEVFWCGTGGTVLCSLGTQLHAFGKSALPPDGPRDAEPPRGVCDLDHAPYPLPHPCGVVPFHSALPGPGDLDFPVLRPPSFPLPIVSNGNSGCRGCGGPSSAWCEGTDFTAAMHLIIVQVRTVQSGWIRPRSAGAKPWSGATHSQQAP